MLDLILEQISKQHGLVIPEHDFLDLDYADDVTLLDTSVMNLATTLGHLETSFSLGTARVVDKNKIIKTGCWKICIRYYCLWTINEKYARIYLPGQCSELWLEMHKQHKPHNRPVRLRHEISSNTMVAEANKSPGVHFVHLALQFWDMDIAREGQDRGYRHFTCTTKDRYSAFDGSTSCLMLLLVHVLNYRRCPTLSPGVAQSFSDMWPAWVAVPWLMVRCLHYSGKHPPPGWKRLPGRPCRSWLQVDSDAPSLLLLSILSGHF